MPASTQIQDLKKTLHGFARAASFARTEDYLRICRIFLHYLRNYLVLFENDASRLGLLYLLD